MATIAEIEALVNLLYGSRLPKAGEAPESIKTAESRLGFEFPTLLRFFYARYGVSNPLAESHERILPLHELGIDDGALVFCVENQAVALWGLPVANLAEADPPVVRAENQAPLAWEPDHARLSDFWLTLAYWQAVNGALGNVGVLIEADESTIASIRQNWPAIRLESSPWDVQFFGDEKQLVSLIGSNQVHAAGQTDDELLRIAERLGGEWDYDSTVDD